MYPRILEPSHDVQFEALYLIIKLPDGISSVHSDCSVVSLISLVSISNTMSDSITIDNGELSLLKRPLLNKNQPHFGDGSSASAALFRNAAHV